MIFGKNQKAIVHYQKQDIARAQNYCAKFLPTIDLQIHGKLVNPAYFKVRMLARLHGANQWQFAN